MIGYIGQGSESPLLHQDVFYSNFSINLISSSFNILKNRKWRIYFFTNIVEKINNKNFKGIEFDTFENKANSNKFKKLPQKWIKGTNAIGIITKSNKGLMLVVI